MPPAALIALIALVAMAAADRAAGLEVDAEGGPEQRLLGVVHGEGVADNSTT